MNTLSVHRIEPRIQLVRGVKVIIDADLAQVVRGGLTAEAAADDDHGVLLHGVRTRRWRTK